MKTNRKMQNMMQPKGLLALTFITLSLAACGNESGSAPNAPAGTNQQEVVNSSGRPDSPDMMPGIGAPGAGGAGTQPGTSAPDNGSVDNGASNAL